MTARTLAKGYNGPDETLKAVYAGLGPATGDDDEVKTIDNRGRFGKIERLGGVAQSVRACGSYPQCPGFKSLHRHQLFH